MRPSFVIFWAVVLTQGQGGVRVKGQLAGIECWPTAIPQCLLAWHWGPWAAFLQSCPAVAGRPGISTTATIVTGAKANVNSVQERLRKRAVKLWIKLLSHGAEFIMPSRPCSRHLECCHFSVPERKATLNAPKGLGQCRHNTPDLAWFSVYVSSPPLLLALTSLSPPFSLLSIILHQRPWV
jgi:hypothetical protein